MKDIKMKNLHLNHLKTIIKCIILEDAIVEGGTTKCSVCGAPVNQKDLAEKAKDAVCPYCKNPYNWQLYMKNHGSGEDASPQPTTGGKTSSGGGVGLFKPTPQESDALSNLKADEGTSVDVAKMFYVEMKNSFKNIKGPGQIKAEYGFYKPIIRIDDNVSEKSIQASIKSAYSNAEAAIQQLMRKVGGVVVNGKFYSFEDILPPTQATTQKKPALASARRGNLFGPLTSK